MSSAMAVAQSGEIGENLAEIESLLGYTFQKASLLKEALTHDSHRDRPSYDRLQFFGGYVLHLVVTKFLYEWNPPLSADLLYALRNSNVSDEKFARAAVRYKLYRFIRHNSPPLDESIREFMDAVRTERAEDTFGEGIRSACKVLANIVKSLAAAVYIDSNSDLEATWKVFRIILEPIIIFDNMKDLKTPSCSSCLGNVAQTPPKQAD